MRFVRIFLTVFALVGYLVAGLTGKIAGRVTDADGQPLIGCNVIVVGTSMGASTDANGEYYIINLDPGSYDLNFSMIGYAEHSVANVKVNVDVTTPVSAVLQTEALQMTGVQVTAERPAIENTLTSSKQYIDGSLTTNLAVATVEDVVKTLPGVTEEGGKLHLRGGRSDEAMYLVDGASSMSPIMGGNAIPVNPSIIKELQVITGTFNAEYGQAMSGQFNTVLKEAESGVHATLAMRTSLGQPYFKGDGKDFEDWDVYDEVGKGVFKNAAGETPVAAVAGTDYAKDTSFGGEKTITDVTASVGGNDMGIILTARMYDDAGRLPGIGEDYQSIQGKFSTVHMNNLKLTLEFMNLKRNSFYDPTYDGMKIEGSAGEQMVWDWKYALGQYPRTEETTNQFGISANYVLSPNTHITARFDNLSKVQTDGAKYGDQFIDFETVTTVSKGVNYSGADGPNHTKVLEDTQHSNSWFGLSNVYGHYFNADQSHQTMGLYVTSQANSRHLIKAGVQHRSYNLSRKGHDTWFGRTVGYSSSSPRLQTQNIQDVNPTEVAAYVQDQMEFNDMIVNVGLRYDGFNAGAEKGVWDKDSQGNTLWENPTINPFDPGQRRATSMKSKISPRLGLSFPVGDNMAFRIANGTFFQRPAFYDLLENYMVQMDGGTESGYFVYIGNPNLDPMITNTYEMGFQYSMASRLKLDLATYYKDISNWVSSQEVTNIPFVDDGTGYGNPGGWSTSDPYQATHFIYKTSDHFGSVKGIEMSVSRTGNSGLTGMASYTYSVAKGTASDKINSGAGNITQSEGRRKGIMAMTTLYWHRPHVLNGYIDYHTSLGGMFDRIGGNITFNAQSGLPQSARAGAAGAALDERAPGTIDVNARLDATLNLGVVKPTVFLMVENVLNRRNVVMIADPASFFDEASSYKDVASGPRNNLLAYGVPMTMHFGISINY